MYQNQSNVLGNTKEEILNFIKRFQNEGTIKAFTEGCCYWFAKILDDRFNFDEVMPKNYVNPQADPVIVPIKFNTPIKPGFWY